ncbi:hypothetical protein RBI13_06660 [Alcaligenaceae bacterium A4P071]|nr:hypothetical protein [Alcaligenaceae bacterium A4P071]
MSNSSALLKELKKCLDRARVITEALAQGRSAKVVPGLWEIDAVKGLLTAPDGGVLKLAVNETTVISLLARSHDHRGSFEDLLDALDDHDYRARNRLAILVSRLRARGGRNDMVIPLIGERSRGYIFMEALVDVSEAQVRSTRRSGT